MLRQTVFFAVLGFTLEMKGHEALHDFWAVWHFFCIYMEVHIGRKDECMWTLF